MKILIIADTHISPLTTDVEDFKKLGEYCVEHQPDAIVHLGDVADMDSLNHIIAKRGVFSTEQELKYVRKCFAAFEQVLKDYNEIRKENKKKMYKPSKYLCLGNHDTRKDFEGIATMFSKSGWTVSDFLVPIVIDGVSFVHCVMNGTSGAVAVTPKEILANAYTSVVVGHSHKQGYESSANIRTNEKIYCLKCPAYNRNTPDWCEQQYQKWDRGFTMLDTRKGEFIWRAMP